MGSLNLTEHHIYRTSIPLENGLDVDIYRRASRAHGATVP